MEKNNLYVRKNIHHTTVTLLVTSLVAVLVIFISIGYSAINASLMVTGDLEYEAGEELYSIIAKSSKGLDTNIDFGVVPTADTSGVYKMNSTNSDKYPVYYYRGIVANNNVKFAGFCWKIVRTTDTGGIKLIYNGTPSDGSCNNTGEVSQIEKSTFNSYKNEAKDIKHCGYTYDTNTDSTIKSYIDNWYSKNMVSYTSMLEDTVWCNDRSISKTSTYIITYGGAVRNFELPYRPSIICPNASDRYTVSSSIGNGLLKYPVALLTADEAKLTGNHFSESSSGYLHTGLSWWTMTPYNSSTYFNYSQMIVVYSTGYINSYDVYHSYGVRPALSLKLGTRISSGDGSYSNPYQVIGG